MGKYVTKNQKEDEKRVVSVRIRRPIFEAFKGAGFIGPTNRYRAQALDALQLPELNGQALQPPSIFIGGSRDPVRSFFPGGDLYADPGEHCAQFRGATLIEGAGHWVQQEAPEQTNGALKEFLEGL